MSGRLRASALLIRCVPALALCAAACGAPDVDAQSTSSTRAPQTAWVEIGKELFELELALDDAARFRGLSGRQSIPRAGGMLFVFPRTAPLAMVMRDCPVPIDVAFLDDAGRVVALHEMRVEPPQRGDESRSDYERRLRSYQSRIPARMAIETAGGRLAEVGLRVGDRLVFDIEALLGRL